MRLPVEGSGAPYNTDQRRGVAAEAGDDEDPAADGEQRSARERLATGAAARELRAEAHDEAARRRDAHAGAAPDTARIEAQGQAPGTPRGERGPEHDPDQLEHQPVPQRADLAIGVIGREGRIAAVRAEPCTASAPAAATLENPPDAPSPRPTTTYAASSTRPMPTPTRYGFR
jgi:hypothetical protein